MPRRRVAAFLSEETCPRCGTARTRSQTYCVECGLRLPKVTGALAGWRRHWLRGVGWYPGDWVWLALILAAVAAGGAAAAVETGHRHALAGPTTYAAPAPPLAPVAKVRGRNGHTVWPPGLDAWTVVLLSSPSTHGRKAPLAAAAHAVKSGLPQVGVLRSSTFASLHPGYYVVFSGVYGAPGDAQAALETVRSRGYGGAYVLRVAP